MPPPASTVSVAAPPASDPGAPMTRATVLAAYRRMAPFYDWMFGACFEPGRRRAVDTLAPTAGQHILEVGVGTGLALRRWPVHARITGIDLSPDMLTRAERARRRHQLDHVTLRVLDAQDTDFPDNHFDGIAAMYVVSVVPDLPALLREMRRICRPGGRIAIVNHFAQTRPLARWIERTAAAHAGFLGFNAALPLEAVTSAAGLRVRLVRRVNWAGYWTLVVAENDK